MLNKFYIFLFCKIIYFDMLCMQYNSKKAKYLIFFI